MLQMHDNFIESFLELQSPLIYESLFFLKKIFLIYILGASFKWKLTLSFRIEVNEKLNSVHAYEF